MLRLLFAVATALAASQATQPPLEHALDRLSRVADLYQSNVLKFTADEVTHVDNYLGDRRTPPRMRLVNVYSYYRDEEGVLRDRRIRKSAIKGLEKAGSIEQIQAMIEAADDPMSEHYGMRGTQEVPAYLERPYMWINFFSGQSREQYDYRVETAESSGAMRIRFRPREAGDDRDWYGTVDLDPETFQIVHVEALQSADYREVQRLQRMLDSPESPPADVEERTFVVRSVTTDFSVVEHGVRFPGRVEVSIHRYRVVGSGKSRRKKSDLASRIVQTYKNYRFFDVEVMTDYLEGTD